MPELPEVETIRRGLEKYLVGHVIEDIDIRLAKQFVGNPKDVVGLEIIGVWRAGKGLVIDLSKDISIAIHVKMTGQLIYEDRDTQGKRHPVRVGKLPGPFTHVIFYFDNDAKLFYNDLRQFGWIKVVPTKEVLSIPYFKGLGPEPSVAKAMDGRAVLTLEKFQEIVGKRKMPIKLLLMDQKLISGIGNIYANDALYVAGIHPRRSGSSLSKEEVVMLFVAIEEVLKKGLSTGGASEWQYVNVLGEAGTYQNFFQVYGRDGKPCTRCGTSIERMKMGGRGTFYCPVCQR